jgi:ornithine carbamoyltransferase
MMLRHFLKDTSITREEQTYILRLALEIKADRLKYQPLRGPQAVAIMTDKPTLRTQVSFSVGVAELGGYPMFVDSRLAGVGRRESIADVTRVLTRQTSAIVWRTYGQDRLEEMAAHAAVPVINALTDDYHPCQVLADLMTIAVQRGSVEALAGAKLAYLGDGANNMAQSYLLGGALAGLNVVIATPEGYAPKPSVLAEARAVAAANGGAVAVTADPHAALTSANVVATDTWVSMGQEDDAAHRQAPFAPYRVDAAAMALAAPDAIFIHCLPAYRGKEVSADVIDGPASRVWDEAENRLHVQKALLIWLLSQQDGTGGGAESGAGAGAVRGSGGGAESVAVRGTCGGAESAAERGTGGGAVRGSGAL